MSKLRLKGQLTISRTSRDVIHLQIKDERSGTTFAELDMTPHDFAMCVTGLGAQECALTMRGLHRVGLVREQKTEEVFFPSFGTAEPKLEAFEVDGWIGCVTNMHSRPQARRYDKIDGVEGAWRSILFERWVPTSEADNEHP